MSLPTQPIYTNEAGQPVYWVGGANIADRPSKGVVRHVVIHHTAGTDSRLYLRQNDRGVSCHYLVGAYADTDWKPRIYKYASEADSQTFTQGFGRLGNLAPHAKENCNSYAIGVELEGPPVRDDVVETAAVLVASILRYWRAKGRRVLLLGHIDIDTQGKTDPAIDWHAFVQRCYA